MDSPSTHPWGSPTSPTAASSPGRSSAVAVPFRAAERNRRVASSVLAGGIAYRIFLWLLPFGLILGGTLGFMDADSAEDAVDGGGLPAAVVNAIPAMRETAASLVAALVFDDG